MTMNSIFKTTTNVFKGTVCLLNQPLVKEGFKRGASTITFTFGLLEIRDVYQMLRGREISTGTCDSNHPKWIQMSNKIIILCAKVSLILSAGVSRPGVFIISSLVGCVASERQLEQVFGPNTIYAINPRHPRHIISIVAVALTLPSILQSTCKVIIWSYRKIRHYSVEPQKKMDNDSPCLTDFNIRLAALYNTIVARPTLHILNRVANSLKI